MWTRYRYKLNFIKFSMDEFYKKLVSFVLIFLNCSIRSCYPSQYVPIQQTCNLYIGSPYFARALATFAEFAFYRQVVLSLDILHLWYYGWLLGIWFVAEVLSWIGLLFQSKIANSIEDFLWMCWFIVAFLASDKTIRVILLPIILIYVVVDFPMLYESFYSNEKVERYVKSLASCGDWVVGSVCGKLLIYLMFLGYDIVRDEGT